MRDRIIKMIPEIDWVQDKELKDQVVANIEDALKTGGWEPEDMDKMPFTLLIPDCPASLNVHNRGVTRMAKKIYEEYNPLYKDNGGFALDHDTLIAGAILHDVGKLVEYEKKDGKVVKSKMGKDLRHPFSGVGLAMRNNVPSRICHCIAVHAKEETIKSFLGLL